MIILQEIVAATDYIKSKITIEPQYGLILGSGLGVLAEEIKDPKRIPYENIPHFPVSTVTGHQGQLVIGKLANKQVIAMQGRFHYYEGYSLEQVTFPVRVMKALGVHSLIVTNAAGGVNEQFNAGDLMIITDHLNLVGSNPLIGKNNDVLGTRFPDMSAAYDPAYIEIAKNCAEEMDLAVQAGVYAGNAGPMYETPAEVRMIRAMGGDAVGMSTVPEVIVARHANIRVLGISCISNMAAGILEQPLTHEEVIETTNKVRQVFLQYVKKIVHTI